MNILKNFELNNKVLDDFDTLMTYHLDRVEELTIKEISINPKLYNIISLCINVKTLIIEGDMRVDTNKIVYNLCKPELLENIIFNSVKLPTNKIIGRFTNLHTISLSNIKFSDVNAFFNQIGNKDSVIALKLDNVDLRNNSINICSEFKNLQFLNIDNLSNCKFDDFSFLINNPKIERINIQNIKISFEHINTLCKIKCRKNIEVSIDTNEKCEIENSFEVDDENIVYLIVNITDLEKTIDNVNFYKINKLCIILDDKIDLNIYMKTLKKIKNNVSIAIKDILYLDLETTKKLRDRIHVEYINILENRYEFNVKHTYSIDEYITLREEFDKIKAEVPETNSEIEKFLTLYEYFKKNYKLVEPSDNDDLEDAIINHNFVYNSVAIILNSALGLLNIESKVIDGTILDNSQTVTWNQVKLDGKWYNLDLALDMKYRADKKIKLGYLLKNYLYTDEQFYKAHNPQRGEPELCDTVFENGKINDKSSNKGNDENEENSITKKIFNKFKNLNKSNRKGKRYATK